MISGFYHGNFRLLNWLLPAIIAAVVIAFLHWVIGDCVVKDAVKDNRATLYGAIAAVAGSLLGFAIALIPITQGLVWMPGLRPTLHSPHAKSLFGTFLDSVIVLGVLTIAALVALLFDRERASNVVFQYIVGLLAVVSGWKLASAVYLMWLVLMVALKAGGEPDEE